MYRYETQDTYRLGWLHREAGQMTEEGVLVLSRLKIALPFLTVPF